MKKQTNSRKTSDKKKKEGFSSTFIKKFASEIQAVQSNKREET